MKPYGNQFYLKKKVPYRNHNNLEKRSIFSINYGHQILNTINLSFTVLILALFFVSFDSQRKWSNTYKTLFKTKAMNNNLIDYISKTEEFYISELESLNTYKKTKPKDLIYLDKISEKKQSYFKKNLNIFFEGLIDSRYQKGY